MQKEVDVLKELITVSEDGLKGYSEAADLATDASLKSLFAQCAAACKLSIGELQTLVTDRGQDAPESGSAAGALHRTWLQMKATLEDKNIAVLEEVERGQDHAKAAYIHALKAELSPKARVLVQKQAEGALANHDKIRDLRNSYKAAKASS